MSEGTTTAPARRSVPRAPLRRFVGASIVVVVLVVEVALGAAWFQLRTETDRISEADSLSIAFTDVRRLFQDLRFLAATEERFDTDAVDVELALLDRQLAIAARRLDDPATTPQLAGDIRSLLVATDELRAVSEDDPTDRQAAIDVATAAQLTAQSAVDRTAAMTRDDLIRDALAAERTATVVALVGALLLMAGAALVWAVLGRYQRTFDEAWAVAAERQTALEESNEQLRLLAETRERFISVLSHELRSPLAVIGAAGETLHHHGDELDPATRHHILESLRRQVGRQQRMIDDLLLVARHANLDPEPKPTQVDVAELLRLVDRGDTVGGPHTSFDAEPGTVARVDEHHLEQVIDNLVRNAEKYGGERIEVRARATGDEVVITVADDGPGVPDELRPSLFEPFTQGAEGEDGVGLGLSISRRLVEANGGTITYRDAPGGGALFEIRIPRAARTITA